MAVTHKYATAGGSGSQFTVGAKFWQLLGGGTARKTRSASVLERAKQLGRFLLIRASRLALGPQIHCRIRFRDPRGKNFKLRTNSVPVNNYDKQKWYDLYKTSMLELERAVIAPGRIGDARTEIASRLATLGHHPALHKVEYQAVQDALHNLLMVEREEPSLAAADRKRLLKEARHKLQLLAPRFQDSGPQENSNEG